MLISLFLGLVLIVDFVAIAQDPCANAPNPTMRALCKQIHQWDSKARTAATKKKVALPPGMAGDVVAGGGAANPFAAGAAMAADFAPIASNIYQCMTLACVCPYLEGNAAPNGQCTLRNGQVLRKAYRKEYRQLTDDERQRFHNAYWSLKNSGEYDNLARTHKDADRSESAHAGPSFAPWHREFVKRFEFALRQVDSSLSLPYLDWTMDANLQNPKDSVLFSQYLMGEHTGRSGCISNGPFTNWRTIEGHACVTRSVGVNGTAKPMEQSQIDAMMADSNIDTMLGFPARRDGCPYRLRFEILEFIHGQSHLFVGGDMGDTPTSANDPIFFLHHSFTDYVWEMWRQRWQSRAEREIRFPQDDQRCSSVQHFANNNMMPFTPMKNRDGLSNMYLDNLWEYAPRPTCSASNPNGCNSQFLFCDLSHGGPKCTSKIKPGAPCNFYSRGENPCYLGVCQSSRCVMTSNPPPTPAIPPSRAPPKRIQPQESCFNENKCCQSWAASGQCNSNPGYMHLWCKPSCGRCQPTQYRLADDCSDRHRQCASWSRAGECQKNPLWMEENCRKSCNLCSMTRAQECTIGMTAARPHHRKQARCESAAAGCYNENICCSYWSMIGECRRSHAYMFCNCRVSCGVCYPTSYFYGSCVDYHESCRAWARRGECQKNPWMSENCRHSCKTCYSEFELHDICGSARAGSISPTAPPRHPRRRRPHARGWWGANQNWGNIFNLGWFGKK